MKGLVNPAIEAYAEAHSTSESDLCRALREETYSTMEFPHHMVVGPLEGAFLKMMVRLVQVKLVLELGMFTGYSALAMAEALPEAGRLVTCEIELGPASLARRYFAKNPHGRKVEIKMRPALETLCGLVGPFGLIFLY